MLRVRFAPSPTGYLHIGSARTFIFNWLYAKHSGGKLILRIDDTDVERSTRESLESIFEGLQWLNLGWDELYHQSDRGSLHRGMAEKLLESGYAYRDFTPAVSEEKLEAGEKPHSGTDAWLFNPGMRELSQEESDRRASIGEPFVLRFRVPRETRESVTFTDRVYGEQTKATADIEDFALVRSSGIPTYHLATCADDADLMITTVIRGQDHLTNTFKHILIFEGLGLEPPEFAHLPLLLAPDGAKLSKRKHGPVVSVTSYRDAGFLPHAFMNFVALLGWNPKDDQETMSRRELEEKFTLEGVNKANATVTFSDEDPFDPKAVWLNGDLIRSLSIEDLTQELIPFAKAAFTAPAEVIEEKMPHITPLIQERIKLLSEVAVTADFFFAEQLPPYEAEELIPKKGDAAMAASALKKALEILPTAEFTHDGLESALRVGSEELGVKAGQMFQPIRVAVCGRKNAPPLFETLAVLGRETCIARIEQAIELLS